MVVVGNTYFGYFGYDGWREVEEYGIKLVGPALEAHSFRQFVWGAGLDELLAYRRNLDFFGQTPVWQDLFAHRGRNESVVRLVDSSGAEVEAVEYDPYGRAMVYVGSTPSGSSSVVGNPYLWNGRRLDSETGLIYVRNRYYSPSQGRFMTHDPNGVWFDPVTNGNGYGYGNNNPLLGADRNGEWFGAIVGALVGAVVGYINEGTLQGTLAGAVAGAIAGATAGLGTLAGGAANIAGVSSAGSTLGYVTNEALNGRAPTLEGIAVSAAVGLGGAAVGSSVARTVSSVRQGAGAATRSAARGGGSSAGAGGGSSAGSSASGRTGGASKASGPSKGPSGAPDCGPKIVNSHLAGKTHPKTGIPFDKDGFPDFSSVSKRDVRIDYTGSRAKDFKAANKAAGYKSTPEGYTWHHHQNGSTMQLVPTGVHRATGHTGGFSLHK